MGPANVARWQAAARRTLSPWQAESEANRIVVAFWRDHPAPPPAAATELRLANFVAQAPNTVAPDTAGTAADDHFHAYFTPIAADPAEYAWYQKRMVRLASAEQPSPSFCQAVAATWPA